MRHMDTRKAIQEVIADHPSLPSAGIRRALRERHGLSQRRIAEAVGVSREAITKYEAGDREPRGETRRRYAEALDELARP